MNNVGVIDRTLRALLGAALISLVFIGPQTVWGWVGLVPFATAITSFCPLYTMLGIRTCQKANEEE